MGRARSLLAAIALAACAPAVPVEVHELPTKGERAIAIEVRPSEADARGDEPLPCAREGRWVCSAPSLTPAVVRGLEAERRAHPGDVALALDTASPRDLELL